MKDAEILDFVAGGIAIKDMTALTFLGYIARKIDGLPAYKADMVELRGAVASPPYGVMPEGEKVRLIRKLLNLDVTL